MWIRQILCISVFFFFFQAEDGIRDDLVTGVQTCALPIYPNVDQVALQQRVQDRLNRLSGVGTITLSAASQGFNSSGLQVNVQASNDQTLRTAPQLVLNAVQQAPTTTDVTGDLADASLLINVQAHPTPALLHAFP